MNTNQKMNDFIRAATGHPQPTTATPQPVQIAKANAGAGLDLPPRATTTNEAMNIYIREAAGKSYLTQKGL